MIQQAVEGDAAQAVMFASKRREYGLRFVSRVYPARVAGLALGGIAVAGVFWTEGAPLPLWFALWACALAWPHFAYGLGVNSVDPYRTELRCLMVDSALGGAFIALMKFNLMPSALFVAMLSMDKLTVGGPRFLLPCTGALVAMCLVAGAATGFQVRLHTTMLELWASVPLLLGYPLMVGWTTYRMARQLRYQNKQLEAMSRTEGLAAILTRAAWERLAAEEFELCRRSGLASSILLVAIDDLEVVNERYGHATGDEVLRSIAVTLRNALREQDVPGRFGGVAFAALLSGSDEAGALRTAEHVRRSVATSVLEKKDRLRCSVSVGVAPLEPRDASCRDWIAAAQQALGAAQARGGNRVELRSAILGR
ncbi:MAG TPA: diguanylate cyclase [Burkholderiales bacterium]